MSELRKIGDCEFSRPGATTYIENGELKEAAADVPVFEGGGFRVWGQVTNLLPYSDPLSWTLGSGASWSTVNDSDFGQVLKGDGVSMASLSPTSASAYGAGVLVNDPLKYTIWVKVLRYDDGAFVRCRATGSSGGQSDYEASTLTGWTRISTEAVGGGSVSQPIIGTSSSSHTVDILVCCAQFSGNENDPHIPTNGAAATCPKSDCQFTTPAALSEDSWEWSCTVKNQSEPSDRYIMSCGNIGLHVNDTNVTFAIGTDMVTVNGLLPDNVETEITIQKTPTQITLNGTSVPLTQTPSPGSTVHIGSDVNFLNQLNGYIKEIGVKKL